MATRGQIRRREGRTTRALRAAIAGAATLGLALTTISLVTPSSPASGEPLQMEAASASSAAPPATVTLPEPSTTSTTAPAPPPTTPTTAAPRPAPASTTVTTVKPATPKPAPPVTPEVRDPQVTPQAPGLLSLLQVAQAEVGGPEARYTTGWGFSGGFWCAKFVSWVLAHAGIELREDGPADFRFVLDRVDVPVPGDLVFIDLIPEQKTGQPTHIGIVEALNADGSLVTIEGNADDSGLVTRRVRTAAEIVGFGRAPAPTSTTVIPAPEVGPEADCVWVEIGKPWLCDWWTP